MPAPALRPAPANVTMLPLFLVVLAFAGGEPAPMPFTTIAQGSLSQIDAARTVVVRTPAEWAALWNEHAGRSKPPAVDFATSMVVAVFTGMRPSGGHSVQITQIEKSEKELVVTYTEVKPGRDDITTQALTFPFHIVRTDAHAGPVRFRSAR